MTILAAPKVAHISTAAQNAMWPRKVGLVDLRDAGDWWEERREIGKQLREQTPREAHADWSPKDAPTR